MIVQGRLVVSFEAIPTLAQQANACCVIEINEDGHLVGLRVKRPHWPRVQPAEEQAADLAQQAARLVDEAGTAWLAQQQAADRRLSPELQDFLRQLVALAQLRGDEAQQMLGAQRRRPGLD